MCHLFLVAAGSKEGKVALARVTGNTFENLETLFFAALPETAQLNNRFWRGGMADVWEGRGDKKKRCVTICVHLHDNVTRCPKNIAVNRLDFFSRFICRHLSDT